MNSKNVGRLTVAGTHIGCLEDLPVRSLQAIRDADLLVFEEDKPARQVLKAAGVQRTWLKFSEQQEQQSLEELRQALRAGQHVLYMSDQGMPGVADPGNLVVREAIAANAKIVVIPGPSSITAALAACPFQLQRFYFAGLPPRDENERQEFLSHMLEYQTDPCILIDTPYRLRAVLNSLATIGFKRRIFIAVDISGANETYLLGLVPELSKKIEDGVLVEKLNFVMILEGGQERDRAKRFQANKQSNRRRSDRQR